MFLKANTIGARHLRKTVSRFKIVMTHLLGKPRERACLSHNERRHRQATGNKFVFQPLNKGVILIR